ncbi:hypothetical protein Gpo141_00011049 [Globisporangium polare]
MVSLLRFLALATVACAALAVSSASPLKDDPYTLKNGRVIDPTNPQDVEAAKASSEDRGAADEATTLHDSPMRGYGRTLRQ